MAQLDLLVLVVHKHQLGLVGGHFFFSRLGKAGNDEQIARAGTAGGRAVHRDHAAAALALDGVGDKALAVINVPDVNLFVFHDVGGIHQVFVNGARAFVVQLAVRGGGAVDFGFEQGAVHGGAGVLTVVFHAALSGAQRAEPGWWALRALPARGSRGCSAGRGFRGAFARS